MERKLIKVNIDGIDFKIMEFVWKDSLKLEKKTLSLFAPVLDILGSLESDEKSKSLLDMKINNLGTILQKTLLSMEDPFDYIREMICCTYYPKKNKSGIQEVLLDNDEIINEVFHGKTLLAVKLCIEVMKANKFAFIEGLGGIGNITGIFSNLMKGTKE
jgi:hypothetical protein